MAKTEKLDQDDPARTKFAAEFEPQAWLADAAKRAPQIVSVTHALKHTHPDARGTSLHVRPSDLPTIDAVGTHALGGDFTPDVVGNAAALDVAAFLGQRFEGRTLLELAVARDPDLMRALSDQSTHAESWIDAFAAVASSRGQPTAHTLSKQVFWLMGDNPCDDTAFEQLLILTPTSLVHRLYIETQADRFGDDAKAARAARREERHDDRPIRVYNDLAVQKLGGTKPQNLSQLNSQRRGQNPLLASLPPDWRSDDVRPIYGPTSMFAVLRRRSSVDELNNELVAALTRALAFLKTDPRKIKETRVERDELIDRLIDEFVSFSGQFETLPPGWTQDPRCRLPEHERRWLDPWASQIKSIADAREHVSEANLDGDSMRRELDAFFAADDDDDAGEDDAVGSLENEAEAGDERAAPASPVHPVVRAMASAFANWLNDRLGERVGVVGEQEARYWRKQALGPLRDFWESRQ